MALRSHWSDGHLYSGERLRKLCGSKKYFLIEENVIDPQVFLSLYDAECYCMEHGYNPDEVIKSADPEVWERCMNIAREKSRTLKEQADRLNKLLEAQRKELEKLVEIRDRAEKENKRNFEREINQENVIKAIAKSEGLYEAYKDTHDRYWYYEQIVLFAKQP